MTFIDQDNLLDGSRKEAILEKLADVLEEDIKSLSLEYQLNSSGLWDSMAVMIFIAAVDDLYNISLIPASIHQCETLRDLFFLIDSNLIRSFKNEGLS